MGELRRMNRKGDSVMTFDADTLEGLDEARAVWETEVKEKGALGFRLDGPGQGEQIKEFDPSADVLVIAAPLAGG